MTEIGGIAPLPSEVSQAALPWRLALGAKCLRCDKITFVEITQEQYDMNDKALMASLSKNDDEELCAFVRKHKKHGAVLKRARVARVPQA